MPPFVGPAMLKLHQIVQRVAHGLGCVGDEFQYTGYTVSQICSVLKIWWNTVSCYVI